MKLKQTTKKNNKINKNEHSILELIQYKAFKQESNGIDHYIINSSGLYCEWFRIDPNHLAGLNDHERENLMWNFEQFERTFNDDHSIISLKFPPHVEENLKFWIKCLNEARKKGENQKVITCKNMIRKITWIKNNQPNQEFYLVIYGKTHKELIDNRRLLRMWINVFGFHPLPKKDLTKIIFKMNNMNTLI